MHFQFVLTFTILGHSHYLLKASLPSGILSGYIYFTISPRLFCISAWASHSFVTFLLNVFEDTFPWLALSLDY